MFYALKQQTPLHDACGKYNTADGGESLKQLRIILHLIQSNADIASKDWVSKKS